MRGCTDRRRRTPALSSTACALAQQAARSGFSALYVRAPRLLGELRIAHGDGTFSRRLALKGESLRDKASKANGHGSSTADDDEGVSA